MEKKMTISQRQAFVEDALHKLGQRMDRFDGHIQSISNDVNATSRAAEEAKTMCALNAVALQKNTKVTEEIHEVALFIKEWTNNFNGFFKVITAPARFAKKYWKVVAGFIAAWAWFMGFVHSAIDHLPEFLKVWK